MKAIYADWSCPEGPAELVDCLIDADRAVEVDYAEFAEAVDVSTAPLEATQFEILSTDWHVTWLKTALPSGAPAWVMQHSGIEHLFLVGGSGRLDRDAEVRLAQAWEGAQ